MLVFFSIVCGIVGLFIFGSMIDYFQKKKEFPLKFKVEKKLPIKRKIELPIFGDLELYDFERDADGNISEQSVLFAAYVLSMIQTEESTGKSLLDFELDDDGTLEVVFNKTKMLAKDRLALMSYSTNVDFVKLSEEMDNPLRKIFHLEIMTVIQNHVESLIDEAFYKYASKYEAVNEVENC